MTRLVVGLGNPGPKYAKTRHNAGFRVLDHLALHEGLLFQTGRRLEPYVGPRSFAESIEPDFVLLKPETYMNCSGDVIAPVASALNLEPESILVVYDDVDLELGRLRLRPHGGAGGQKGMRSTIDRLGSDRFPRLRFGIGRGRGDVRDHVLEPFTEDEEVEVEIATREAAEAILDWVKTGDIEKCMTEFHRRWTDQRPD
jgi:PTH1 family peptidyl-tRNA hydrolase